MMIKIQRQAYQSDLNNQEWEIIEPLLPAVSCVGIVGRPQERPLREILNAIFYVLKTGCQWHMLPEALPPKGSVYYHFRKWSKSGYWQNINETISNHVLGRIW